MATDLPDDDELGNYVAAQLANAAHPIVEAWQRAKRETMGASVYVPTAAQLDALERALADLYSVLPDMEGAG